MEKKEYKKSVETREKLLKALISLVNEKGYGNVSVRDICARANISSGSFYYHFGSKEALVMEAYFRLDRLLTDDMVKKYDELQPMEAINELMEMQINFVETEIKDLIKDYYRVLLEGGDISAFSKERIYYSVIKKQASRILELNMVKNNMSSEELTDYLLRFLRGLIMDWAINNFRYSLIDQYKDDYKIMINGLL
ncbi:MAG: TetR/AcrR family transcriptional regulator [Tissierellia bacterium]|nr:TetR/AcrR family transcriptional regulator [Tissierellia bacterium]